MILCVFMYHEFRENNEMQRILFRVTDFGNFRNPIFSVIFKLYKATINYPVYYKKYTNINKKS